MIKIRAINNKHKNLLTAYVKRVQEIVYYSTEDCNVEGKFSDFTEVMDNVIEYSNAFKKYAVTTDRTSEWFHMFPNLVVYSAMGFLNGLKTRETSLETIARVDELFELTVDLVGEMSDMLEEEDNITKIKESEYNN